MYSPEFWAGVAFGRRLARHAWEDWAREWLRGDLFRGADISIDITKAAAEGRKNDHPGN